MTPPISSNNNLREQFVTEQIPVGLPWRLMIFSAVLFGFSIFVFFGLRFGYESYLSAREAEFDKKFEQLASRVSQEDQKKFVNFYSQLANLKRVLDKHSFTANIFSFLEKNTVPTVFYYDATFSIEEGRTLLLGGRADSVDTFVAQLAIFDKAPELERVSLKEQNLESSGDLRFNVELKFKGDFFKSPKQ